RNHRVGVVLANPESEGRSPERSPKPEIRVAVHGGCACALGSSNLSMNRYVTPTFQSAIAGWKTGVTGSWSQFMRSFRKQASHEPLVAPFVADLIGAFDRSLYRSLRRTGFMAAEQLKKELDPLHEQAMSAICRH